MIDIKQQSLNEDLKRQIYKGFSRHAIETTGYDEKFEPVAFVAVDGQNFAGAVVVAKFWGALHVKYVYVNDAYRNKALASSLMHHALGWGLENNCTFAFVETMSFQALEFYKKAGFQLEFTRTGYAHGTSFHYLRKDLLERENK
ncbi:MAG TPA: GNAT family N-acetyltransferase [Rhabdochlamydiaceae bacterium]